MFNPLQIDWTQKLLWLLVLIPSLTIHEIAHGLAAYCLGDRTAKRDGRLSLNPLRHIDPLGLLFMIIYQFGWAKPVMVNPNSFKNPKEDMAITSLAGPLSNLVLAFLSLMVYVPISLWFGTGFGAVVGMLMRQMFIINLSLAIFNLLPLPPLDGSKVFGMLLPVGFYWQFISFPYGMPILLVLTLTGVTSMVLTPLLSTVGKGMSAFVYWIYQLL